MALCSSSSAQQSEINVTPLIDVLLVLLIIFMVIVPVTPRGLESQVPQQSTAATASAGPVSLRVLGERDGGKVTYVVDGHVVERSQLTAVLLQKLSTRAQRSVYITAGAEVSYRDVAQAVSAAEAAGASVVALGRA